MRKATFSLLALSLATGCTSGAIATFRPEPAATTAEEQLHVAFGGAGELSDEDLWRLQYIAFPQSYDAMKDLLGFPARRYEEADVYKLGNDSTLWVYYQGTSATGYEVR